MQLECKTNGNKKKFVSILFVTLLIVATTAVALQWFGVNAEKQQPTEPNIKDTQTPAPATNTSEYTVITSSYYGIPYDLYYPANFSGSLVILAGGIMGEKHYLSGWAQNLAQEGYASLAFSTKQEDLQHVPEYVENCRENMQTIVPFVFDESMFPISINEDSVSAVGMSGGAAAVLSYSDERIKANVAVCPYYVEEIAAGNTCPTLIITGQMDYIAPHATNGQVYYNELTADKMITEQVGVGHDISTAGWKYVYAWLDYYTENDTAAYTTIEGAYNDTAILSCVSDFG
jgi:dienelactone hydrolase